MAYIGNFLLTRLAQNLDQSSTSMTVTSGDGAKFGAEMIRLYGTEMFPYYLIIRSQAYGQAVLDPNREIVQVTARDEDTFTIARGTRGTTAVAHYSGDYVQLSLQADDLIFPETTVRRLDPNLCLYLPLEEGTGTMTKDLSGWSNHGTLVNGPTWTNGRVGKCLSFDGSDDYVNIKDGALVANEPNSTIEVWIKWNGTMGEKSIYDESISYGGTNFRIRLSDGVPNFDIHRVSGWCYTNNTTSITSNDWHHIVGVLSYSGGMKIYVDGIEKGSNSNNLPSDYSIQHSWIGRYGQEGFYFPGLIDEVRIYNRALSASEIQDHYLNP